jgi:hypothetical protein
VIRPSRILARTGDPRERQCRARRGWRSPLRLAENGFERLGRELDATMGAARGTFTERLVVFAQTYVRFAARHSALLAIMHASNDRPNARHLRDANNRALRPPSH